MATEDQKVLQKLDEEVHHFLLKLSLHIDQAIQPHEFRAQLNLARYNVSETPKHELHHYLWRSLCKK